MNTLFTGKNFLRYDELPSTNDHASGLLSGKPPEGTVVFTRHQTAGKGQRGNEWVSEPAANLTFSVIYYPTFLSASQAFFLNKITSLALIRLVEKLVPEKKVRIKWPNDMLIDRKKTAGILIENSLNSTQIKTAVIGIGLNINQLSFPENLNTPATSLHLETNTSFDPEEILPHLLENLEVEYLKLKAGKFEELNERYLAALFGYQEKIEIIENGQKKKLLLTGIDAHGRILFEDSGEKKAYSLKEITFCL